MQCPEAAVMNLVRTVRRVALLGLYKQGKTAGVEDPGTRSHRALKATGKALGFTLRSWETMERLD